MRRWFGRSEAEQRSAHASLQQLRADQRRTLALVAGLGILCAGLVAGLIWFLLAVLVLSR